MNLRNFLRGAEILRSHYNDPDGYHIGAEHDQVYFYETSSPLSDAEYVEMIGLGWFQPDCEEGVYSHADGWSAFV